MGSLALHILQLALASPVATRTILYTVSATAESLDIGQPLDGFISYSIEFSSFPDFAGNKSHPNEFSNNLLNNIGNLTGTKPYIRVGGNTQDFAIYNPNLTIALNGTFNLTRSADYPTTIEIGPSFFESYTTWPDVKFSHGFNLGGNNDSRRWDTLLQTVPLACKALGKDRLYLWEYGNEPDLFSTNALSPVRSLEWNESDYVAEWLNGTRTIKTLLQEHCPELASDDTYGYIAPSFAGTELQLNHLKAPVAWADGLNEDENIKVFSSHNYISSADTPGVTLQGTLMNHTRTRESLDAHLAEYASIPPLSPPHILGEYNSLSHQGRPGTSDTFGAALWALDFAAYAASRGVARAHAHLGTNYRYASWQPVPTDRAPRAARPPYYADAAAAFFVGSGGGGGGVAELGGGGEGGGDPDVDVAYAAYGGEGALALARVLVLNLRAWNGTAGRNGTARPVRRYAFDVGGGVQGGAATVRRLLASGSDATAGITWDGVSYAWELDGGRPVRLGNVTVGERAEVRGGVVEVEVADSQAVVLDFGG